MIFGTGQPKFVVSTGLTWTPPHPTEREMDPNEIAEDFENLDEELIKVFDIVQGNICRYRPVFTLRWKQLSATHHDKVIQLVNLDTITHRIQYFPHEDINFIGYDVLVEDYTPGHPLGNVNYDSVELVLKCRYPISKLPSPDNMISAGAGIVNDGEIIFELNAELKR